MTSDEISADAMDAGIGLLGRFQRAGFETLPSEE